MNQYRPVGFNRIRFFLLRKRMERRIRSVLAPYLRDRTCLVTRNGKTNRERVHAFQLQPPREDLGTRVRAALPWISDPVVQLFPAVHSPEPRRSDPISKPLVYRFARRFSNSSMDVLRLRQHVGPMVDKLVADFHGHFLPAPFEHRAITITVLELFAESIVAGEPDPELRELIALASEGNEVLFVSEDHRTVYVRCGDTRTSIPVRDPLSLALSTPEPVPS